jgi:hypothetical protein
MEARGPVPNQLVVSTGAKTIHSIPGLLVAQLLARILQQTVRLTVLRTLAKLGVFRTLTGQLLLQVLA